MSERLPDWIDPASLAEAGKEFSGPVKVAGMGRLVPLLEDDRTVVQAHLRFGMDSAGTRFVAGRISGELTLICQRCLEPMRVPVRTSMRLGIVASIEAGEKLTQGYEPLLVGAEPVRLSGIIEDELLLCLPAIPVHAESAHCKPPELCSETRSEPDRENPFAVLAELKHKL